MAFFRPSFRSGGAGVNGISAKIETYRVTKVDMLIKYEDYVDIFVLSPTLALPSKVLKEGTLNKIKLTHRELLSARYLLIICEHSLFLSLV